MSLVAAFTLASRAFDSLVIAKALTFGTNASSTLPRSFASYTSPELKFCYKNEHNNKQE